MGRKRLWDRDTILAESSKYKTPYEFQKKNKKAYSYAHRNGLLAEATSHMTRISDWTIESMQVEALKFNTRGEFSENSRSAYTVAHRNGWLDQVCSHMGESYASEWTPVTIQLASSTHKTRSDFQEKSKAAYNRARKLGILDSVCTHMKMGIHIQERNLLAFLKTLSVDFEKKRFGQTYELDCYSESLKIGVEYNGLYWHHEEALKRVGQDPKKYHLNKTLHFESVGVRVIHIWEHEWLHRPEQVKDFLRSACGENTVRIGARELDFREVSSTESRHFLNRTHIQGAPSASIVCLGAFDREALIGVCSFGRHHRRAQEVVLNRFACLPNHTVMGFLSKASKIARERFGRITSWADYSKSQAKGYLAAGWVVGERLSPDYFYYDPKSKKVISKQSRKKNTVNTPAGMTERQHSELDGLFRIYDCGKIRLTF